MTKILQTGLIGLGGLGALYYGQVGYQIYRSHSEANVIEKHYKHEIQAATTAEITAKQQETLAATLLEQIEQNKKELVKIDANLKAAREKVVQLETQRTVAVDETAAAVAAVEKSRLRVVDLLQQVKRHKENAELAHEAMLQAKMHSKEIDVLTNPMNHPIVKSLFSK